MTFVLNEYLVNHVETYEPLIKDSTQLGNMTFADFITSKIYAHLGKSDKDLCSQFGREYNNNKAQWTDLVYRMLGIKSNHAAEFRKANVVVKVIRLEPDKKMKENISFPPFKYMDLVSEQWETSTVRKYFDETKFFFVVFQRQGEYYFLRDCRFWNMPYTDLNLTVKAGWDKIVETIKHGVKFTFKQTKSGIIVENNFPKKADNPIIHIRPHAAKRYFQFPDGRIIGDGTKSHANQLPDGTYMPNYSFWINNDYILDQLHLRDN